MKHRNGLEAPIFTMPGYFARFYQIMEEKVAAGTFLEGKRGRRDKSLFCGLDIYEMLEQELLDQHNVCMYSSYDSFKTAKSRFLNNNYIKSTKKPQYEQK